MLAFPTTTRLPPSSTVLLALLLTYLQLSSIRRPYITFKLLRSNIDTPQRLRNLFRFPATGMCHFLPVHHLEWHFLAGSKGQNITKDISPKVNVIVRLEFELTCHDIAVQHVIRYVVKSRPPPRNSRPVEE